MIFEHKKHIAENSTVLIVDDIPENLQVLANVLMSNGLDVGFAVDGRQAIEAVEYNKPDLILLDIMMPGIDGFEVCRVLKENPHTADIPIIYLTAKTQTDDIVKGFDTGAVDYVTKPFNPSELLARVFTQLEVKKSRDIIEKQAKELAALNASKDKFFSIISHDLKSPYTGLLGLTNLIITEQDNLDKDEIIDIVGKLNSSLKNQYSLIENLLNWARIQTDKIEYSPLKFDLHLLINEVISILKHTATKKNITLINESSQHIYAFADRFMIQSVLSNLISNSIKFSFKDSQIITSVQEFNDFYQIKVTDFGTGIKPENIDKLFKIDVHLTTLGTENEKGTGLGLILCKEMIEMNGGTISVESVLGSGTTFSFTLKKNIEVI